MNVKTFFQRVVGVVLVLVGATPHIDALAQEAYFTHPSSCVAPFLYQAERMRWHEHFLMNPPDGQRTWAVCPVDMYIDDLEAAVSGGNWLVQVYLQHTSDAVMVQPKCFFTMHSVLNQNWAGYIEGLDVTYTTPLLLQTNKGITVAEGVLSVEDILASVVPAAAEAPFHLAVYCRLDPGWGINGIELLEMEDLMKAVEAGGGT